MTLEAKNLTFRYPRRGAAPVLEGVSLTLRPGERLGLSAPSGRGKTTLCKLLAGWEEPSGGQVLLDGLPLARYRGFCPVQLLWQHPDAAVDPLLRLRTTLEEAGPVDPAVLEGLGIFDGDETMKTTTGTKTVNLYRDKELDDLYYWFGSDNFGRDIWTRTWSGARVSLIIAVAAAIIDMVIGMSYGLISGYFGGRVDMLMQRFLEVANGIPRLVIVTLLLLVLQPGMLTIIFALMLTEWVGMSRIARAEMLKLKEQEFVLASRTLGAGSFFIIFKEILPNIIGPIITQVMFSIPTAIFTEAFLSFVGLGIPVPQCSLGSLISEGFNSFTTHPYQIIPPIVVMALLMLSFNMVADGLREALDPKMKEM